MIATLDGLQQVRLSGDARASYPSIRVGDYLKADGVKQTEQLFDADNLTLGRAGSRVR